MLRHAILTLALLGTQAVAFADLKGNYTAQTTLPDSISSGKLEYKLELKGEDEAKMTIKRTSRLRLDRDATDRYGEILTFLESPDTVTLTGTWSKTSDGAELNFDRIRSSEDSDRRDLQIRLFDDEKGLRVDSWDASFFGPSQPRFMKATRNSGNDLLAGLAVVAAGALVLNSVGHGGGGSGNELRFETGGNGSARFGNGDRSNLRNMRLDLRRDGNGTIYLDGSFRVEIRGRWQSGFGGYQFRANQVTVDGRRISASGNVNLEMDSDRRRARGINGYLRLDDFRYGNLSMNFRSARG